MAAVGLVVLGIQLGRSRESVFHKDVFLATLLAVTVSLVGYISATFNETSDYSYATYLISMWVWLSGAYVVISTMKWIHGSVDCRMVCDYLIAVCVVQCMIAILMEFIPSLKHFVDSFLGGEGFMGKNADRLYGIGAALDVAGSRFAVVLVMIAYICANASKYITSNMQLFWYLLSFVILLVIGNMIARTTLVGAVFAIPLFLITIAHNKQKGITIQKSVWSWMLAMTVISSIFFAYLYQTNEMMHEHIRFAFEGFFSWIEDGRWEVRSNIALMSHWDNVPESLKTWIIGDGYFVGHNTDPYYLGTYGYFYGDTDVGYLRFIYYFGVIGLLAFSLFFIYVTCACCKNNPTWQKLFVTILLINFIVWTKVSTDVFLVMALFLVIGKREENDAYEEQIKLPE